jgi:hypothetical protein
MLLTLPTVKAKFWVRLRPWSAVAKLPPWYSFDRYGAEQVGCYPTRRRQLHCRSPRWAAPAKCKETRVRQPVPLQFGSFLDRLGREVEIVEIPDLRVFPSPDGQ